MLQEESKERKDNRNVDDDSSKTENYKRILLSLLQQKDISFQYTDVISTSSNRLSLLTVGIHPIHVRNYISIFNFLFTFNF